MRLKITRFVLQSITLFSGLACAAASIFAIPLGLDNDPGWGRGRILLLAGGCLLLAGFFLLTFWRQVGRFRADLKQESAWVTAQKHLTQLGTRLEKPPSGQALEPARQNRRALVAALLGAGTVIVVSWGYLTAGTWVTWTPYSHYYDQLADGFLSGQLSLPEKPSAQLLALAQPYDYHNREGIPVLWDASLYEGKYYLYFGPVPALAAALVKLIFPGVVEDQYLLFGFLAGYILAFAWVLLLVRRFFFPRSPGWMLFVLVLLGGLALPMLWLVNRPDVYETAIAAGQCFLILGLALLLRGLQQKPIKPVFLLLAGVSWGLAANSRADLAVEIVFFVLMSAAWLVWIEKGLGWSQKIRLLLFLFVPLGLFAAGMAWYNAARFGSIFETGHRYQLTGLALPSDYSQTTSLAYILPNLYNYLIRPLLIHWKEFPFVFTPFLKESMWPFFIQPPPNYVYAEPVSGILATTPAVLLGLAPAAGGLGRFAAWVRERPAPERFRFSPQWAWLGTLLAGGSLLAFATILVYIFSTMRYLADVTPLLALTAGASWYRARELTQGRPYWKALLNLAAVALIVVSIGISLLAAFQAPDQRFMTNNPQLYAQISALFTR